MLHRSILSHENKTITRENEGEMTAAYHPEMWQHRDTSKMSAFLSGFFSIL